jgi:hypothetical protein
MQFSLLNFLIGLPQVNALANAGGDVKTASADNQLFSELLGEQQITGDGSQNADSQTGGDLTQELVSNITAAQDAAEIPPSDDDMLYLANIQGVLNRKLSPERAKDLLEQFNANTNGERPPEVLKEILESVEANGEPVSVQEILSQVASAESADTPVEQRGNTLQRALQWLQQALTPNAVPMEALAFANAAAMFPQDTPVTHTPARRGKDKEDISEGTEEIAALMPQWVQNIGRNREQPKPAVSVDTLVFIPTAQQQTETLPDVDLPTIQTAEAAPVEEGSITADDA